MKDFGELHLSDSGKSFKVYVGVLNGEIVIDQKYFDYAGGYVSVFYSGAYAGTIESLNRYINESVENYLLSNNLIIQTGETVAGFPYYEIA